MSSKKKIGIALSGGGARGIAHLGVLKALNEAGIFPSRVSGASAGAIVGSLYCQGYSPDEIFQIIKETKYFKFLRPAISLVGILKMEILESLYSRYLGDNDFSKLKTPLTVVATDICKGKVVYFTEGEIIKPVMASSCIPGMFDPILIDGSYYVDGGILNNLPIEALEGVSDVIIGVNCNHLPEQTNIRNIKNLIERTIILSMNYHAYSRKGKCDFFIEPSGLAQFGAFDIKKAEDIFATGYEGTLAYLNETPALTKLGTGN